VTRTRGPRALTLVALLASFVAGAVVDRWLRTYGPPRPVASTAEDVQLSPEPVRLPPPSAKPAPASLAEASGRSGKPDTAEAPPTLSATPVPIPSSPSVPVAAGLSRATGTAGSLPRQVLRVPIDGVSFEAFKGGFAERRDGSRPHEAVDILEPRGTPIHAVVDGTVAKLFFSKAGGTTIYEFDPDGVLCYYYAHLDRYADGLHEGQHLSQGEVIGYVGTSGNAPANTPHLHFAVFELNAERHWWQGKAVDPYLVFKNNGPP
jgi:murein DD-endopeptidase MepM/ murein hydrolase activator NlpD